MPPLNLLLLPLLGGFVFISLAYPTRYLSLRTDGYRLIFWAAICATGLLLLANLAVNLLLSLPWGDWLAVQWHLVAPPKDSGKAFAALTLGFLLALLLNTIGGSLERYGSDNSRLKSWATRLWLTKESAIDAAINRRANPLEMLLRDAVRNRSIVSITVKSGKVYIGRPHTMFHPAYPMESLGLVLIRSGHRHKETLKLEIDIDYSKTHKNALDALYQRSLELVGEIAARYPNRPAMEIFQEAMETLRNSAEALTFQIVIPMSEVQSVSHFDPEIYDRHFKEAADKQASPDSPPVA